MKNILWYLLAGTRGGEMRARILHSLYQRPQNAHQLSKELLVDYKTVQHHLRVLEDNRAVTQVNKGGYGAVFFISEEVKLLWSNFDEIWEQFGKTHKKQAKR